jgi:hypothetical protein
MATRSQIRMQWSRVEAGRIDDETTAWLADVARKVLEADKHKGNERRSALAAATGLHGTVEEDQGQLAWVLHCARHEIEAGHLPPGRASVRDFAARLLGLELGPDAIDKRINRVIGIDDPAAASLRVALGWATK